jgi:hypothetical protein
MATLGPPPPQADWIAGFVAYRDPEDPGVCPGPEARRHHQLASFVAPTWWSAPALDRPLELGLVLYGGESPDGEPLDDLWIYTAVGHDAPGDLSPADDCPWLQLTDDATPGLGVAEGHLFQEGDGFRLVGGRESRAVGGGTEWIARARPLVMDQLEGALHDEQDFVDEQDFTFGVQVLETGSPWCALFDAASFCEAAPGDVCAWTWAGVDVEVPSGATMAHWTFGSGLADVESRRRAVCEQARAGDWRAQPDLVCVEELYPGACTESPTAISDDFLVACPADPFCQGAHLATVTFGVHTPTPGEREAGVVLTSAVADGVWGGGAAHDPVEDEVWWYGGTSGACQGVHPDLGGSCSPSYPDGENHLGSFAAFNVDGFLHLDPYYGASQDRFAEPWDPSIPATTPPPRAPTVGVRGGALVGLGLRWDGGTRQWTATPAERRWVLVGGTLHQDVEPLQVQALEDPWDPAHETLRFLDLGPAEPSPAAWWVDPPLRIVRGTQLSEESLQESVAGELFAGDGRTAVAAGPDEFITVGGTVDRAQHEFMVWGDDGVARSIADESGAVRDHFPVGGGLGLAAATDPVTQTTYVFGTFGADPLARDDGDHTGLLRSRSVDAPDRVGQPLPLSVDTRLRIHDPAAARPETQLWEVQQLTKFLLDCADATVPAEGCRTDRLSILADPAMLFSSMVLRIGGVEHEVLELARRDQPAFGLTEVTLQVPTLTGLPVAGTSPIYELELHGELAPMAPGAADAPFASHRAPTWLPFGEAGTCGPSLMMSWDSLPVQLADVGVDDALGISPLHTIEVIGPAGYTVVAPWFDQVCEPNVLNCCQNDLVVTTERRACVRPSSAPGGALPLQWHRFSLELRPHTATPIRRTLVGAPSANVWLDECMDPAVLAEATAWVTGPPTPETRSYGAAAAWVHERLGSDAARGTEAPLALWIGRGAVASDGLVNAGYTKDALMVLTPFGPDGEDPGDGDGAIRRTIDGTATHELAHVALWRRTRARFATTEWLDEAAPTLLSLQRVPGFGPDVLYDGLSRRVSAWTMATDGSELVQDLTRQPEPNDPPGLVARLVHVRGFLIGPYLLAQNLGLKEQGVDARPAWQELRDTVLAQGAPYTGWTANEVSGWLDDPGPAFGFTADRVQGQVPGEPLLALRVLDHPPTGGATVEVAQVQQHLATADGTPFPLFPAVPYAVGCANEADGSLLFGSPPFLGCDVGGVGQVAGTHLLTTASEELVLSPAPATDTSAAWFALLAGPQLVPEQTGLYGLLSGASPPTAYPTDAPLARPTWWLSCAAVSTLTGCAAPDADGDGFVRPTDCDDTDPAVHPGAPDPSVPGETWTAASLDLDCDSWPGPWLFVDPTSLTPELP